MCTMRPENVWHIKDRSKDWPLNKQGNVDYCYVCRRNRVTVKHCPYLSYYFSLFFLHPAESLFFWATSPRIGNGFTLNKV